jgi:hypothetical protein
MITAHPDANFGQLAKLIGESWNALPTAERGPFVARAAEDKLRYEQECGAPQARGARPGGEI